MQYPQIYIGSTPETAARRRALRTLAMDLRARLRPQREPMATLVLLHTPVEGVGTVDLVVLRPNVMIVGAVRAIDGPLDMLHATWSDLRGTLVRDDEGRTPLAAVGYQRDTLRARLLERIDVASAESQYLQRVIAAVICAPALPPESRIALDIEDHRALRKVLGLDELPGLVTMASSGVRVAEVGMAAFVEQLGGRLWHDGTRLLFELAAPRYRLRLLGDERATRTMLPLIEGENLLGRRRTARPHEHRLTIAGDDLVSSDHAIIICHDDGRVTLRDISKNGTWMTLPDGPETFVHTLERTILPGTILRLGDTQMLLQDAVEPLLIGS
jgi:FHA domain